MFNLESCALLIDRARRGPYVDGTLGPAPHFPLTPGVTRTPPLLARRGSTIKRTFRAACERWPKATITLRQGARVIEDSRSTRVALRWSDKGPPRRALAWGGTPPGGPLPAGTRRGVERYPGTPSLKQHCQTKRGCHKARMNPRLGPWEDALAGFLFWG